MKSNAMLVIIAATIIVLAIVGIYNFTQLTKKEQLAKVKEWLLYAVVMAEKELGAGTGKLKLRYVYDLFLTQFSWLADFVTFETFSKLVDEALEEMKRLLENNEAVQNIVNNTQEQ